MPTMAPLTWALLITVLIVQANLIEGKGSFDVTFTVTHKNYCQWIEHRFSGFSKNSISDCVKECALRPYCKALNFHVGLRFCELFSVVDTTFKRNGCFHILRKDITTKKLPCGRVCKKGTMCDPKTKSCIFKDCVNLPEVENGKFLGNCRSVGSKLSAKCVRYYKPKNDIKHTFCTAKGTWEPSTECIPMRKCKVPKIENGEVSSEGEEVGSKLTLTCYEFYLVKDDIDESYCTPRGEWEPAVACERVPGCIELPEIQNGEIVGENTELGSIVSVTCNQYYEAKDGISQSVCTSGGWDPTLECIPIQGICDELDIPANLTLAEANGTAVGSIRQFACKPDFVDIETSLTWTCQPAGNWDGKASKCVPKFCTDMRCYAIYEGVGIPDISTTREKADTSGNCISKCEELMGDNLKSIVYNADNRLDPRNCKCYKTAWTAGDLLMQWDTCYSYFSY